MKREGAIVVAVLVVVLILSGAIAGWYFTKPGKVVETPKLAETQADGSIVVERTAPAPKAKPKQVVPQGGKVERIGSITAQGETPAEIKACTNVPCPPVTIDTSLIRMPDGSRRVVVSSADGTILKGVDIPVETLEVEEAKRWAAGVSLNPLNQTMGAWVERDIGRIRLGVEINQTRQTLAGPVGSEIRARVGWVW